MRTADSHKGDNGIVAIIGGSRHQHGAPIFSALAAEASGVDLLHVWVPVMHEEVTKHASYNFQVHTFGSDRSDEISSSDRERIIEHLATIDAVVIGPGLSRGAAHIKSITNLLAEAPCPIIADATALHAETLKALTLRHAIMTPHLGELERMGYLRTELPMLAKKHACTILLKSSADTVVSEDGTINTVTGGNAGLTVGGTGDALAGLIAGLVAQGMSHADACTVASTVIKRAGDSLYAEIGFSFTTHDVIRMIPRILRDVLRS